MLTQHTTKYRKFAVPSEEDWEYANSADDLHYPLRIFGVATDMADEARKPTKPAKAKPLRTVTPREVTESELLRAEIAVMKTAAENLYWKRLELWLACSGISLRLDFGVHHYRRMQRIAVHGKAAAVIRIDKPDLHNINDSARESANMLKAYFSNCSC
jgi:hypothetical protein